MEKLNMFLFVIILIIFTLFLMIITHWNVSVGSHGHFDHSARRKRFLNILMLLYFTVGGAHWGELN